MNKDFVQKIRNILRLCIMATRADLNREARALGFTKYAQATTDELRAKINAFKVGSVITNWSGESKPKAVVESDGADKSEAKPKEKRPPNAYIKFQSEWRKANPDKKGKEVNALITEAYYEANPEAKARRKVKSDSKDKGDKKE